MMENITGEAVIFEELDNTWNELFSLVSADGFDVNEIPFEGSWTVARLMTHIIKSNQGIAHTMEMKGKPAGRNPQERAEEFKKMFLDFDTKFKSPEFIVPEERNYIKQDVIGLLGESINKLKDQRSLQNLEEMVTMEIFGNVTRLELLYFVLYHTQRHIHQLKNMLAALKN